MFFFIKYAVKPPINISITEPKRGAKESEPNSKRFGLILIFINFFIKFDFLEEN